MYYSYSRNNGERFLVPFLLGGLAGGAIAASAGPRPVFVNSPYPAPMPMPVPMPRPSYGYYNKTYYEYY